MPTNDQPLILSVSHLLIDSDYRNHPSTIFHRSLLLTIFNAKVRSRATVGRKSLLTNLSKNNYSDRRQHVDLSVFTSPGLGMSNDPSTIIHLYTNTSQHQRTVENKSTSKDQNVKEGLWKVSSSLNSSPPFIPDIIDQLRVVKGLNVHECGVWSRLRRGPVSLHGRTVHRLRVAVQRGGGVLWWLWRKGLR